MEKIRYFIFVIILLVPVSISTAYAQSLYVDARQKLSDDQMFNFKYFNGKVFSVETIGEKWSAFQILNFKTASQPFYIAISPDMTLLNSPIQYSNANDFEIWLKEGLANYSSF